MGNIKEVMIYPYSSRATREMEIEINEGINNLTIQKLPQSMYKDSVRVNIIGKNDAIIKNVNLKEYYEKIINKEELEKIKTELKELKREQAFILNELNRLDIEFNKLANTTVIPPYKEIETKSIVPMPMYPKSWEIYITYLEDSLVINRRETRDLLLKKIELDRKIKQKQNEENKLQSYISMKTLNCDVVVLSKTKGKAKIEVSYIVPNASWFPVYDLRIQPAEKNATLTTYAIVQQNTGEDWENVPLYFSTASPFFNMDIAKLKSWRIKQRDTDIIQTAPETMMAGAPAMEMPLDDKMGEYDSDEMLKEEAKMTKSKSLNINMKRAEKKSFSKLAKQDSFDESIDYKKSEEKAILSQKEINGSLSSTIQQEQIVNFKSKEEKAKLYKDIQQKYYSQMERYYLDDFSFDVPLKNISQTGKKTFSFRKVDVLKISGGYDYRFSAINVESILSTNEMSKVTLKLHTQPVELVYQSIPKESTNVYLKAVYKNESDAPILEGSVRVFMDSDYIGESYIRTISTGENASFSLGIDDDIKILRREKKKREKSGVFGKSVVISFDVEIEVISYKENPTTVEIIDSIPRTGQADDISVFDEKFSIPPEEKTTRGILKWRVPLKKGEKKIISIGYKIKHPEDFQLVLNNDSTPYMEGEK